MQKHVRIMEVQIPSITVLKNYLKLRQTKKKKKKNGYTFQELEDTTKQQD